MNKVPEKTTPPDTVRVVLLEDHQAIREMLKMCVQSMPGFSVVGDYGDAREALQACKESPPGVFITDLMMSGYSGLDLLQELHAAGRLPPTLVFTANTGQLALERCLSMGVLGYIEKTASFSDFRQAISSVAAGQVYLGPQALVQARQLVVNGGRPTLSPRETSVLKLIAEGHSSKEIAGILHISHGTVESHRANISRRTGLHAVAQFTLYAIELGLIDPPQRLTHQATA